MGGLAELIFRGLRLVSELLGRPFREWSEWAENNPAAAARQLELIAGVLSERSRAYKRQDGWRARRDKHLARALSLHAFELRAHVKGSKELASACAIKPGAWPGGVA